MLVPAMKMFYSNRDGLVEVDDDVLSIVSRIREDYGSKILVRVEPTTGHFVLSENCDDGTERLIFTTDCLDQRVLERLAKADQTSRGYVDTYAQMERQQDLDQAAMDNKLIESVREDAAYRIAHALKKDGIQPRFPLTVPIKEGIPDA